MTISLKSVKVNPFKKSFFKKYIEYKKICYTMCETKKNKRKKSLLKTISSPNL